MTAKNEGRLPLRDGRGRGRTGTLMMLLLLLLLILMIHIRCLGAAYESCTSITEKDERDCFPLRDGRGRGGAGNGLRLSLYRRTGWEQDRESGCCCYGIYIVDTHVMTTPPDDADAHAPCRWCSGRTTRRRPSTSSAGAPSRSRRRARSSPSSPPACTLVRHVT
jgi:hypothetical protein